jgi:uncharacterized protein (TIGR01777 family)
MSPTFLRRVRLPVDANTAFAWHERPGALERLKPPWRRFREAERHGGIRDSARVHLDFGFPLGAWTFEHFGYQAGRVFRDRQIRGPFARFEHTHTFEPAGDECVMEDRIEYERPVPPLGRVAAAWIHRELTRLFAWRHRVLRLDLERARQRDHRPLSIVVSGASGMVGRELIPYLTTQGCTVRRLVRHATRDPAEIAWDVEGGVLDPAALGGTDAVIHLAGAGIADRRWTNARRRELMESRVRGTGLLARALAEASPRPRVMLSASAIGWYGDRGDEVLDESSPGGNSFLPEVCRAWESAAQPARDAGVRVAHPRIGIALWPTGGALSRLALATRWGAGGPLGNGRQWWSWLSVHDLLDMMMRALDDAAVVGPFNAVTPSPARQRDVAKAIGHALGRPAFTPAPAFALRALLGRGLANDTLLASHRVVPRVLDRLGYTYRDPELGTALARMLGHAVDEPGEREA